MRKQAQKPVELPKVMGMKFRKGIPSTTSLSMEFTALAFPLSSVADGNIEANR